ncbi:MAG: DUF3108 domain-containing protein [Gammaproteobacteria bacterium]|nr:DUF3108 domain-containing protein [Gammaproteobacteria bacterium]
MRKPLIHLLLVVAALSGHRSLALEFPGEFAVTYDLYSKGARIASMERAIARSEDGSYVYQSDTRAVGFIALFRKDHVVERSLWTMVDDSLRPLQYTYQRTGSKRDRNVSVRFDWDAQRIINTINGDSWRMPTAPNVMDKLLYQLAVMHDLKSGRTPLIYTVADGGKIKTYDFERRGEETVSTPLGDILTLKLTRHKQQSEQKMTLWCAPHLSFLPVKVENVEPDGTTTVAIIQSITGAPN